ncbi:GNAT family N-acetyltransferase [Gleimia europaea]|uniref:N-acetyltransferase domain-containing protein n=1 Tax=Gleimia europaea ACS-120-V-Col10b TaxID=883069 RepID=A0A9W5REA8_9ACTO|nr:GNAT family N-acetyltransferase [Gleimia europaea]EPD30852.1 hypothetical protein HMPREF9238_00607 [Gleimia europaea ACS-120-V-Col10b]
MNAERLEEFLAKRKLVLRQLNQDHLVDWFDCGRDPKMNEWFSGHARKWQDENLCRVWILSSIYSPGEPSGFFTLSAHQVTPESVPKSQRAHITSNKAWVNNLHAAFPATLLGKFALAEDYQGRGLGEILMLCAYVQHMQAAIHLGSKFLVLDVQHDSLAEYYADRFGFLQTSGISGHGRMIKSTKTIEDELEQVF